MIRLGIVGLGQQALRTHLPCIELARKTGCDAEVVALADCRTQLRIACEDTAMQSITAGAKHIAVQDVTPGRFSDAEADRVISAMVSIGVDAVIVATEPLSHFNYMKALESAGLYYLVDKPFICRPDISLDPKQANLALDDLRSLYERLATSGFTSNPRGSVNVTRRFNDSLRSIRDLLLDAERDSGQIVTHVAVIYSDGEHRGASGCYDQDQHPFRYGYGALNHSGYHAVDTAVWMADLDTLRTPAMVSVQTQSRSVAQFLCGQVGSITPGGVQERVECTEYDSIVNISVERNTGETTLLSVAIIHDSASNRRWSQPRNIDEQLHLGRLSHELTAVTQGELQNALVRMVELPHADVCKPSHALPSRMFHADITRNPFYARDIGRPVYENVSPDPIMQRSLASSSKYKALCSFLAKVAGQPYDREIDIDRHLTSQLILLLAARSLAGRGTVETEKLGARAQN
jgi:predicted dehydrogenase